MTNPVHTADSKYLSAKWIHVTTNAAFSKILQSFSSTQIYAKGYINCRKMNIDKSLLCLLKSFLNIITRHQKQRKNSEYLHYMGTGGLIRSLKSTQK